MNNVGGAVKAAATMAGLQTIANGAQKSGQLNKEMETAQKEARDAQKNGEPTSGLTNKARGIGKKSNFVKQNTQLKATMLAFLGSMGSKLG